MVPPSDPFCSFKRYSNPISSEPHPGINDLWSAAFFFMLKIMVSRVSFVVHRFLSDVTSKLCAGWARGGGGLSWLDQAHFLGPFHVWHSISLPDKQSEHSLGPLSTNYRSPCQLRGYPPHTHSKLVAEIVTGEDGGLYRISMRIQCTSNLS